MREENFASYFAKFTMFTFLLILSVTTAKGASDSLSKSDTTLDNYQIEKPGTITFTTGSKIIGKVEKPQVMIFLIKEKPIYKDITIDRSFKDELLKPLPYLPITY